MATVSAYTKAKMDQIANETVNDGRLDGDNLILIQRDLTEIDVGSVRGPQGIQGPEGNPPPTGCVFPYGGDTAPTGYLLCDGSAVSRVTYAALFSVVGTKFGAGDGVTTFNLPPSGRFIANKGSEAWNNQVGETGGVKDLVIPNHDHPLSSHAHTLNPHSHPMDHNHGASANTDTHTHGTYVHPAGAHGHGLPEYGYLYKTLSGGVYGVGSGSGSNAAAYSAVNDHTHSVGINNDTHSHTITVNSIIDNTETSSGTMQPAGGGTTADTGESASNKNLPPYFIMNYIIKT